MNEEVRKRFYEFLAEFLRQNEDLDVKEVTFAEEKEVAEGFCETCYNEYTEVEIHYVDSREQARVYSFYGTMGELFVL